MNLHPDAEHEGLFHDATRDALFANLSPEELPLEPPSLRGRESGVVEHLDSLVRELQLIGRKQWRFPTPVQTSADMGMEPGRVRELVRKLMQLTNLLEQRLELRVFDGQDPVLLDDYPRLTTASPPVQSLNEPFAHSPLVLSNEDETELRDPRIAHARRFP